MSATFPGLVHDAEVWGAELRALELLVRWGTNRAVLEELVIRTGFSLQQQPGWE